MRFVMSLIVAMLLVAVGAAAVQEKSLTTEHRLKAEVALLKNQLFQVRVENAQCRAALADATARIDSTVLTEESQRLQKERESLETELREALGASDDEVLDWTTSPPSLKKKDR